MEFKEIEFKYKAAEISFSSFTEFCASRGDSTFIQAAGYDYFYASTKDGDSFARHRVGPDMNQLTFKRKTTDKNNFVRAEHNIDLQQEVSTEQIAALCSEFGYEFRKRIFKNVFIYLFDRYNFVFYICYDDEMNELGRFIEIEMSEEHDWGEEKNAWEALLALEQDFKRLGITAQKRMKNSLFELFAK